MQITSEFPARTEIRYLNDVWIDSDAIVDQHAVVLMVRYVPISYRLYLARRTFCCISHSTWVFRGPQAVDHSLRGFSVKYRTVPRLEQLRESALFREPSRICCIWLGFTETKQDWLEDANNHSIRTGIVWHDWRRLLDSLWMETQALAYVLRYA